MAGKGSRARPLGVSKSQFDDNWDRIFGKKEEPKKEEVISNSHGNHAYIEIDELAAELKNKSWQYVLNMYNKRLLNNKGITNGKR